MKNHPDLKFLEILQNIQHHFGFLFKRGFQVISVIFIDQDYKDWQVTMATDNCIIKIYSYTGRIDLAISIPQLYDEVGLLELNDLICGGPDNEEFPDPAAESRGKKTQSLSRIAQLLEKHLDELLEKLRRMLLLLVVQNPSVRSNQPGQRFQYN